MIPKISVIIPNYNKGKYLRECLDSVVGQTFKETEIIIIDDGSTDDSLEIIQEFAAKDSRIILKTQAHQGVSAARNLGIKTATGEFLSFMDSDDEYVWVDRLDILYKGVKENNALIGGGGLVLLSENGINGITHEPTTDGYYFAQTGMVKYSEYQFDQGFYRFIYDREFIVQNAFFFRPLTCYEDLIWFVEVMYKAEDFWATDLWIYRYRIKQEERGEMSREQLRDCLRGIFFNIEFAESHHLERLLYYSQAHLSFWFDHTFYDRIKELESKIERAKAELSD